jgi:hypothetical protein
MAHHWTREGLPKWFDKENYKDCKDFDVKEWWYQLDRRVGAYQYITEISQFNISFNGSYINPKYFEIKNEKKFKQLIFKSMTRTYDVRGKGERFIFNRNPKDYISNIVKYYSFDCLIENGIIIRTASLMLNELIEKPLGFGVRLDKSLDESSMRELLENSKDRLYFVPSFSISSRFASSEKSVEQVNLLDTLHIYEEWIRGDDLVDDAYNMSHLKQGKTVKPDSGIFDTVDLGYDDHLLLKIDLTADKATIINDLKELLKSHNKSFTKAKHRRLYEHNVLAIMDLHLYELLTDTDVVNASGRDNVGSFVLFADVEENTYKYYESDLGRVFREQSQPFAFKLLKTKDLLSIIKHQAF